jgi:Carboxypeptidase regulatory-like domain
MLMLDKRLALFFWLCTLPPWLPKAACAAVGGSVSGTVMDRSGAVIPGASVSAINLGTGARQVVTTNHAGAYSIPNLPVGAYDVVITALGFRPYRRTGVAVDVYGLLLVDAVLDLGEQSETVTVRESVLQVETSSTQLGSVIKDAGIDAMPLNGRSYTDLLALQPGVVPATTITSLTVQGLGQSVFSPSGDLNPGALSINGQRESANGFLVNGADAEETGSLAAAIIPNLDSIAEFRILSENFDAEYGRYSGGQINVMTKSGTNQFHGDVFEFLRNTDFDAHNYFSPTRAEFVQNQFGGTIGGPITRKKLFFFYSDYQGTRQTQGVDSGLIPVPTAQDRTGNLMDQTLSLTGAVMTTYFANRLSDQLGYPVSVNEPYFVPGCVSKTQCVLPNAAVPQSAWSAPAASLLKYIPAPNAGPGVFSTSAYNQVLHDDKIGERIDANTRWGTLFGYYSYDNYSLDNPYPTAQGGANVPSFNGLYTGRAQLFDIGDTKALGTSAVNESHISYTRDANDLGRPAGGLGVSLASQGFVTGVGTLGIVPGAAQGVENVVFNDGSLVIGTVPAQFEQINNDFGFIENFSKVLQSHMLKAGIQLEYDQIDTHPYAFLNGSFNFNGTETGSAYADFLLGISSLYTQNQLRPFYGRNKYIGLYAEDSWRIRPNLMLNYGLRWDRIEPWYEKYNNNITFIPGEQSVVFPTAPTGIVYPGDPGVSRTAAPPGNKDFAPRFGLAYSPRLEPDSPIGKLLGGPNKTSIRAGFGIFYAAIAGESLGLISDNPPYGYTFQNSSNPLFATPFIDGDTGNIEEQRFPAQLAPSNVSRNNPDTNIDFSQFEPIGATPGYKVTNTIPYTEEYMLSLQRQIRASTLASITYTGNQGHHLLVLEAANPGNPTLCLSLPGCGPNGENNAYTNTSGQAINGTRGPMGPDFGSVSYQATIGNSEYNALEASVQHSSRRLQLLVSYTYSKSLDLASNFGEQVDPYDPSLLRGLSSFNMKHNFVASYSYRIPFEDLFHTTNRWTEGWSISGITRFTTGFPVTLMNPNDTSLIGTFGNGINNLTVDALDYTPGRLGMDHNPRHGQNYFNASLFSLPADDPAAGDTIVNTIGNSGRRFFSGPGIENFDMAVQKRLTFTESKSLDFRVDAFNIFNHAQFYGPQSVDGNINDPTFADVVSAAPPRLLQLALKINF